MYHGKMGLEDLGDYSENGSRSSRTGGALLSPLALMDWWTETQGLQ